MPKRRGDGEGSVYQTKDGRWRGEISVGYKPDGKPVRKILYGKTRAELSAALKKALRDQQLGINVKPQQQTLGAFLDEWLEGTVKPKNRVQTHRSYSWIVNTHLKPALGRQRLEKLSPREVQLFLAERLASGLKPKTIVHIRATLRAALSHAQRWGLVHQNAAKLVTVPLGEKFQPLVLSPDQARTFLQFAAVHPRGPMLVTAITLGLRRGELLALRWSDVDLDRGSLRVNHSIERITGVGMRLCPPKSATARRGISLPRVAVQALQEQRERQGRDRAWAGSSWTDGGFVFTTSTGTPLPPEYVNKELRAVLKAAQLPHIRVQDLRHSAATLLLVQGVHPKLVQSLLGHSSYQLTMDTYSHVLPALRDEVASHMDAILASTPTNAPTKHQPERVQ